MREIIKVGLAIIRHGRILLVRSASSSTYILPGGKPEPGEDDLATLRRELIEELGCELSDDGLAYVGAFSDRVADRPDTRVTVRLYSGEVIGTPEPHSEIAALLWFDPVGPTSVSLAPSLTNSILPTLLASGRLAADHELPGRPEPSRPAIMPVSRPEVMEFMREAVGCR